MNEDSKTPKTPSALRSGSVRPLLAVLLLGVLPVYLGVLVWLGFSRKTSDVGYMPKQPVPYSHRLHAGELGLDCRYCHTTVETAAFAAIPPTQTCMNCHAEIRAGSEKIVPVRDSDTTGMPIPWVRVHDLPDYVYFDHSAHVARGVGCEECHGRVDRMEETEQVAPLSMGWCLECHRNPAPHLRPVEAVTAMGWVPPGNREETGRRLPGRYDPRSSQDCSTCHR